MADGTRAAESAVSRAAGPPTGGTKATKSPVSRALEWSIAWRYLRSRKGSRLLSFISVVAIGGVIVGVSALILIMGVMTGLQNDLRDKILVGSPDLRVLNYGDDLKIGAWQELLAKVDSFPGVVAAAPFVLTQGFVTAGHNYAEAAQVAGIPPQAPHVPEVTTIREHIIKGQGDFRFASTDGHTRGVVLGKLLADRLGVQPGDTIRMLAPPPGGKLMTLVGTFVRPRYFQFQVTGLFETGMYEYDNSYIYMPLEVAQDFASLGPAVTGIEVRTTNRWNANKVALALESALGFPYRTQSWQDQNSSLFRALKLEKFAMGFIVALIVLVAAFNIVSTLTMVVTDKTREIGILKAMGMPAKSIRRISSQGVVIGAVGTAIGVTIGLVAGVLLDHYKLIKLDEKVYFIDHMPVTIQATDVIVTIAASLLIATIATLYPSIQAARLFPIDAIRHE